MNTEVTRIENAAVAISQEARPASIMGIIAQLSSNPQVDIEKIERLMQIYTAECDRAEAKLAKEKADEAERLFYLDFIDMKPNLPLIIRHKENTHTHNKYAPLEDINKEIDPILKQYNFATSSKVVTQGEDSVTMEMSIIHTAGHKLSMTLTMPIDDKGTNGTKNKTTGQGIASTMTSTKRIGFCALLNISTGDDKDLNKGAGEEFILEEKVKEIEELLGEVGADVSKFKEFMDVAEIKEIKRKDLLKAMNMINEKKRINAKNAAKKV